MTDVRLVAPRIRVIREGAEPLEVQADNRDLVRWEKTRVKHRWPKFDEAPFQWLTFLAWSAATRTGEINGTTYEKWEAETLDVRDMTSMPDDDDEMGRPTPPAPEAG